MTDPAEVGKYGTIRLLKRREPSTVVAAYPIDDEEVSFGRDSRCSVRLYYAEVSPLHCKIIFEERKAFLQVHGGSGVIVDGCPVYPVKSAVPGDPSTTVTVPLPNGNIFEIHKKRFMFNYPPKALRPQLFTPATAFRKSIRMSLVQSAQVFSPAPSPYPRENLRVLQSPLKLPSSDAPVKLVDSDHPRVYEEEQDLVILEDVEPQLNGRNPQYVPSYSPSRLQSLPPVRQGAPQTPRRRSQPSLHRAVLIRSAQRTAYMRETQEHMQYQHPDSTNQFEEIDLEDDDAEGEEEDEEDSADEQEEEDEVVNSILNVSGESEEDSAANQDAKDDMVVDGVGNAEQDITEAKEELEEEVNANGRFTTPLQVSKALHLGTFMTPQPGLFGKASKNDQKDRRKTGPLRPPPGFCFSPAPGPSSKSVMIKEEEAEQDANPTPLSPTKRQISEEERKAILDRRRSALKMPDPEIGEAILKQSERGTSALPPPLPPPTSPFKQLSTHIEQGEDTQVVLQRMQAQVAERRASLSPTRPRIARDGTGVLPPSPSKTFSLLASASRIKSPIRELPDFEEGMMEDVRNHQPHKQDGMDVDDDTDASKKRQQGRTEEDSENVLSIRQSSRTPRLDGVREMFRGPSAAPGLTTPAVRGVRDLFRAPQIPQTPRMDGMIQLFAEPRTQETPDLEGIGDMMHVDEQSQTIQNNKDNQGVSEKDTSPDVPEDAAETAEPTASKRSTAERKLPLATRTLQRSKGARGPALIRTRGTPTDASTMADDEASPDSAPLDLPKQLKSKEGVPEAAVVHRGGRGRRVASAEMSADAPKALPISETDASTKSPAKRGRPRKSTGEETDVDATKQTSSKPPSKSRGGRRKGVASATATSSEAGESTATQPARRGKRAGSATPEEGISAPSPGKRRTTRARSRSAEPDSDDNAELALKSGTQARVTTVETIPEEEEPVSSQGQPTRKSSAPPTSRNRRTRTRTDSSAEDAPPKKRTGAVKGSATESNAEGPSHIENKENTPETSPNSESGEDSSARPGKTAAKGRAEVKTATVNKTKTGIAKTKASSKTTAKAKAEDEDSAPAPRATRTRARK